jgi:hypothetical protein
MPYDASALSTLDGGHVKPTLITLVADIRRDGYLLLSDTTLPSLATLVAGERIRGSWWGHRRGNAIFLLSRQLAAHRDVLVLRLVSDKLTFVHRRLWPAVFAVAESKSTWQTHGLSKASRALLARVEDDGEAMGTGLAARELESRWLVRGGEEHTASGAHARHLETWDRWALHKSVVKEDDATLARLLLEKIVGKVNAKSGGRARLPWQKQVRRVTKPSHR